MNPRVVESLALIASNALDVATPEAMRSALVMVGLLCDATGEHAPVRSGDEWLGGQDEG